jgi:Pyruvate/2-oxoacid:ferredoxin oxidoreductase delta subunit
MSESDLYEIVRQKMVLGPLYAPKHKSITKLLKLFWNEQEIKILSHFESADKWVTINELEERTGIPRKEIRIILASSVEKGTIDRNMNKYCLLPVIPGIFERYYQRRKDTEENHIKAAELYRNIMKDVLSQAIFEKNFKIFRPLLPIEAEDKLIEINTEFNVQSQALPYELVKNLIDKNEEFAVIPCQCRLIGELSGEPCKIAPSEMGCFIVGLGAQRAIQQYPGARKLTKEEAIEFIKETEKAGLVHNTIWDKGYESSHFICNCCSCHCGALYPSNLLHLSEKESAVQASNFAPKFNMELCIKCETCLRKCPNGAILHKWPNASDSSDEQMILRKELCIGCGICAVNCPKDAIKMIKVRDIEPPEKNKIGNKTFLEIA